MKRTLLSVLTCLLAAGAFLAVPLAAEEPTELHWHDDLDRAVEEARSQGAYLVVDLYAAWCGWCKKLEREVFPSAEFRAFAEDKVLLEVDVEDGGEGQALQARHQAFHLPTTLILDADEVRVAKVQGYFPASTLVERFESEIAAWEELVAKVPQVAASNDVELQRNLAETLHERGAGRLAADLYRGLLERSDATDVARLHYLLADALRLAEDWDGALASLDAARRATDDPRLVERLDLLAFQVAEDHGDCQGAKSSLQHFLDAHPQSRLHTRMARTLRDLEHGRSDLCA